MLTGGPKVAAWRVCSLERAQIAVVGLLTSAALAISCRLSRLGSPPRKAI